MGYSRSRRPVLPLAIWAMTAALAYAAGKHQSVGRKAGEHAKAKARTFKRRSPARKSAPGTRA